MAGGYGSIFDMIRRMKDNRNLQKNRHSNTNSKFVKSKNDKKQTPLTEEELEIQKMNTKLKLYSAKKKELIAVIVLLVLIVILIIVVWFVSLHFSQI